MIILQIINLIGQLELCSDQISAMHYCYGRYTMVFLLRIQHFTRFLNITSKRCGLMDHSLNG